MAADLAGDYKEVATEFTQGIREGAQAVNRQVVGGLEQTNDLVSSARGEMKDMLGQVKSSSSTGEIHDAEVVQDDAPGGDKRRT
mmetsp:Transcript_22759/g.66271  ORF Transcript_22759/g.66271 Transcript_22759/m.66271 type:complete len:84 (+) Transcript_22759:610-861(+)